MKLIFIASVIGVCAAARLEHLEPGYLPPGSHGSASFGSARSSGFDGSNNGLNHGPGSSGGSSQSRSGGPGGDAFGASSISSPQFSSRNNFENIPQQAFDEETGYQYGPGVNNFRPAAASGNQFLDASQASSNLAQTVKSRFNAPSNDGQQSQQFNDGTSGGSSSASAPTQKTFGQNQFRDAAQSSSNKVQSGLNSRFNAPTQHHQSTQFNGQESVNQQTDDNDDDTVEVSSPNQRPQASTAQRPTNRNQPTEDNTFKQQNRGQEMRGQSNHGKQFVDRPEARSQFAAQSGSNQQFGSQSQPEIDLDSNTNQKQSLTSRFNAPNEQFAAASQQVGSQKAAGRQIGARFGALDFQAMEQNPFRNIPQQAFDEKTGYVY